MSVDDLAQPADLEAVLLRPLSATEAQFVPRLIEQASALLRMRVPDVDDRMARFVTGGAGGIDPVVVAGVVARIVKRVLVNPGGSSSVSEVAGPFSVTRAYRDAGGGIIGDLEVTDADLGPLLEPSQSGVAARTLQVPLGMFGCSNSRGRL